MKDKDNIKRVVKDVKYLIATDCNDETVQARIENYIKESSSLQSNTEQEEKEISKKCLGCANNNPKVEPCLNCDGDSGFSPKQSKVAEEINFQILRNGIEELRTEKYQQEKNGMAKALQITLDTLQSYASQHPKVSDEDIKKEIEYLNELIILEKDEVQDEVSWNYQHGILISVSQAKLIVKWLQSLTPSTKVTDESVLMKFWDKLIWLGLIKSDTTLCQSNIISEFLSSDFKPNTKVEDLIKEYEGEIKRIKSKEYPIEDQADSLSAINWRERVIQDLKNLQAIKVEKVIELYVSQSPQETEEKKEKPNTPCGNTK